MWKPLLIVIACLLFVAISIVALTRKCRWVSGRKELSHSLIEGMKHGIRKMRYLQGECINVRECRRILQDVHSAFKKFGIEFWLSDGTALGIRRDGDIMPHDDDVDISVRREDYDRTLAGPVMELRRMGFVVSKVWNDGYFVTMSRNDVDLDISFEKQGALAISEAKFDIQRFRPCHYVDETIAGLRDRSFMGLTFRVPSDPYFVRRYGTGWTKPTSTRCSHNQP